MVALLLFSHCLMLLPLWGCVLGPCIVMQYFVSLLVLQLSRGGRERCLIYFYGLLDVMWLLLLFATSSWCRGSVCIVTLWHFLFKLTYCFDEHKPWNYSSYILNLYKICFAFK